MPWRPSLNRVHDALTDLYPDVADARRVAQTAMLSIDRVDLQGKAVNVWPSILEEAAKQGLVPALIEAARREYPNHAPLRDAARAYYRPLDTWQPAPGPVPALPRPLWFAAGALVLALLAFLAGRELSSSLTVAPRHRVIADTENLTAWAWDSTQSGGPANRLALVPGRTGYALGVSHDLGASGWDNLSAVLDPAALPGASGISFYHHGSGAANTIEFKLMLKYPGEEDTCFGLRFPRLTNTNGEWRQVRVRYSDLSCWWPEASCQKHGGKLDVARVDRLELAVSHKLGDDSGPGMVAFDDVWAIP